ncbi:MAG: asparagine synthase (glutamine-hydrolyzing), partial [Hydrococcus sp. SU_1_0]|nr:asparagine synthase (glutamine-hydrolyzing) [Hydrococcus sp. SU_1_0]
FQALRSTLIAQGEQFNSQTDTEVILKLYQKFGADCVNHFRGMFAFAIWDDLEKTCFLARDPLGIKPLYYWLDGSTLLFASELKAILATGLPSINMSSQGLYGYLVSGSVPEPYTLIEGIHCLPAGHWLRWQSGQITQRQYWQIDFTPQEIEPEAAIEKTRHALIDSIKHHFVSDVPVGIFLSGGIDSTAVLALARQTQTGKLSTYSIAFEEADYNEGNIARQVAKTFDTEHTEFKITASLAKELFPQFLKAIDQPSIDGFNTFCVSQLARQNGTKVVLSGLGGDELFGGYQSFQKVPQMVRLGKQLQMVRPLTKGMGMSLESWGSPRFKRIGDWLQQQPTSVSAYHSLRGIFSHREACAVLQQYLPDEMLPMGGDRNSVPNLPSVEDEVSWLEINSYMRNQLLRDNDVMSMSCGLELRVPLVDRVLIEAIAPIPSHIRLAPVKQLLIQAVNELPSEVINRPKQPFAFPFDRWMQEEWRDIFPDFDGDLNVSLKPWYRRWSLGILQHWWNVEIR